jgi:hypothetical protein
MAFGASFDELLIEKSDVSFQRSKFEKSLMRYCNDSDAASKDSLSEGYEECIKPSGSQIRNDIPCTLHVRFPG